MFGKLAKLTVVMTAVAMTLTIGASTTMAQSLDTSGVTLDPGTENVRDQLIAEAGPLIRAGGYDPSRLDLGQSVASPDGQALFIPVKMDQNAEDQFETFAHGEQRNLVTGLLYVKQEFKVQGQTYRPGLHRLVLQNSSVKSEQADESSASQSNGNPDLLRPDHQSGPVKINQGTGGGICINCEDVTIIVNPEPSEPERDPDEGGSGPNPQRIAACVGSAAALTAALFTANPALASAGSFLGAACVG